MKLDRAIQTPPGAKIKFSLVTRALQSTPRAESGWRGGSLGCTPPLPSDHNRC